MNVEHAPQEQAGRYVAILRERFETKGILHELAGYPNFVVWRYKVEDGKRKKPPFDPNTHRPASPTDRTTWGTLETALHALATGYYRGIGFMLSHSPYGGIDLDHCIEGGSMQPWAQEIIKAMDTYTEYSPSWNKATGTGGVHLLVEGKPTTNKKVGNTEIYGETHYLTITTNHLPGTPTTINARQEALDHFYASLVSLAPPPTERQNTVGGVLWDGTASLPPEARNDRFLLHLLSGDTSAYEGDRSRAEFVCLMKLMHYTGDDRAWTKAIFASHPIGQRAKAQEDTREGRRGSSTYLDNTIDAVLKKRRNPPMRR